MWIIKEEINVRASVAEAFSFLSDLENNPKWLSGLEYTKKLSEGPVGKGTRLVNKFKERGGVEYQETITQFKKNDSFAFEIHVPGMPVMGAFQFVRTGSGTKITFVEKLKPESVTYKLLGPLIYLVAKRQLKKDFLKLQRCIEAPV